jgi:hypothetical protein
MGQLSDIDGKITQLEAEREGVLKTLEHVDALLIREDPGIELEAIKPRFPQPKRTGRERGKKKMSVPGAILRLLRTDGGPMTAREVYERLAPEFPDRNREKFRAYVRTLLSNMKREEELDAAANSDGGVRYFIAA